MNVVILKEVKSGEARVAIVPGVIAKLKNLNLKVKVQKGAGEKSFFSDAEYAQAGAELSDSHASLLENADVVLKVQPPEKNELDALQPGTLLIGLLNPYGNPELVKSLAKKKITAFALEFIPRISRAQSMDVLSSQAAIAGYKAVLLAAMHLGKYFPMLTTAAGTMKPARVLIVGAGVAGLQAIATARRLGAIVEAYDVRSQVKEEIQSLGAKFVDVTLDEDTATQGGYAKEVSSASKEKIKNILKEHVKNADVVITTAQVPGKKAPRIVTEEMISQMSAGSVIVDLAAEQGGNCDFTKAGETVVHKGVSILGPVNLPATIPVHASQMYARNVVTLLQSIIKEGTPCFNFNDEVLNACCITHEGKIRVEELK
ncbi:MAG: Re/Si-specific NAD(P)(+) transhydrogenase subunit alpha [Deltaproteobacteria bacterium]|nr:Re/Si-specific NAD(P)(+) transhydrogenase subunit alpha [Deltaproteobacteria bacterium]